MNEEKEKILRVEMLACQLGAKSKKTFKMTEHRIFSKDHMGFYRILCLDCGRVRYSTHPESLPNELTFEQKYK